MACDAQSVETLLVNTDKYYSLSQRQWLEWLAQLVINAAGITVTAAINLAASRKMAALSDRNLEECRIAAFTAALFDAQSIINEIATQKYPALDRHDLMCATIAAYCAAAGGSAQTVETLSVGNGYFKLSQRDDTLAIDAVICAANSVNCTNVTAVALSVGITGMSDRHLKEVICASINHAAGPPQCATPTGLVVTWDSVSGNVSISWDAVPAGMDNTEVWDSQDNITFFLAGTVAAPGTTLALNFFVFAPYVKIRFTINSPATNCPFTASVLATSNPQAAPTNFVYASNIGFTFVVGGWDAPTGNITSTELWTSSDNITFVLAQTLAAPTATANVAIPAIGSTTYAKIRFVNAVGNGPFTSVLQFTHTDWETRANANSGHVIAAGSKAVQNNLYSAIANAGILTKMLSLDFIDFQSGGAIQVALTPIIKTAGVDPWTNVGMGDAMVGANGLTPTGGPGVGAQPGLNGTSFPSDNNGGVTVYAITAANVVNACAFGYTNNAASICCRIQLNTGGNAKAAMWNDTSTLSVAAPGAGYFSVNRIAANDLKLYFANTGTPHAAIASSAAAAGSRSANFIDAFSVNAFEAGIPELFTVNNTIACLAFHQGLTLSESASFAAILAAIQAFTGGTVP